ncbi:MAG: murein transglycosylase A [Alphaproteobacteria bacterium]|nr:murein transglycosylase A [Alphaproteobacteria bacterium]
MTRRFAGLLLAVLLTACTTPVPKPAVPPAAPSVPAVPTAALRLTRVGFSNLPDWNSARFNAARDAFLRGCAQLAKKPLASPMGGAGYAGTVGDWIDLCARAAPADDPRVFFEANFTPFAISDGDKADGLFTGYYEPEILASPVRGGIYQTPIYALPDDWVRFDLGDFDSRLAGQRVTAQVHDHTLSPYPDRAGIDAKPPRGEVLLWAADPVAVFFLQIQGSGRARLPDGSFLRLAYAGANGQPYTAIGRTLINEGQLTREDVSLQSIRAWLEAHPDQARRVMETDQSYVFFQRAPIDDPALGSTGSLGANLTPLASLAIDPKMNTLGAPFFVSADGADPMHGLLIGQDTGGAIKGAVRGDIFFGFGPQAEERAGHMNAPGRLFVLLPNALAAKIGEGRIY